MSGPALPCTITLERQDGNPADRWTISYSELCEPDAAPILGSVRVQKWALGQPSPFTLRLTVQAGT
jgi:hypothetical protein